MPATRRLEIIWANGHSNRADTFRELERSIRSAQWQPYKSRHEFRDDMRRRAHVWSGTRPTSSYGGSRQFITALADAGLFMLIINDKEEVK